MKSHPGGFRKAAQHETSQSVNTKVTVKKPAKDKSSDRVIKVLLLLSVFLTLLRHRPQFVSIRFPPQSVCPSGNLRKAEALSHRPCTDGPSFRTQRLLQQWISWSIGTQEGRGKRMIQRQCPPQFFFLAWEREFVQCIKLKFWLVFCLNWEIKGFGMKMA